MNTFYMVIENLSLKMVSTPPEYMNDCVACISFVQDSQGEEVLQVKYPTVPMSKIRDILTEHAIDKELQFSIGSMLISAIKSIGVSTIPEVNYEIKAVVENVLSEGRSIHSDQ